MSDNKKNRKKRKKRNYSKKWRRENQQPKKKGKKAKITTKSDKQLDIITSKMSPLPPEYAAGPSEVKTAGLAWLN